MTRPAVTPCRAYRLAVVGSLALVRHARPVKVGQNPEDWRLSDGGAVAGGRLGVSLLAALGRPGPSVVASNEPKAIETAESLSLGAVTADERFGEVRRPWYADEAAFESDVGEYLRGAAISGWEPLDRSVARFDAAISELRRPAVVVSHGTVMSAWLADRIPGFDPVPFWQSLTMPDAWAVDLGVGSVTRIAIDGGT